MVTILILKNGRPVKGVRCHFQKNGILGGWGERSTDSTGQVSFDINPGGVNLKLEGDGISYHGQYHLQSGINEFRF